jgi:hypothetical protein
MRRIVKAVPVRNAFNRKIRIERIGHIVATPYASKRRLACQPDSRCEMDYPATFPVLTLANDVTRRLVGSNRLA